MAPSLLETVPDTARRIREAQRARGVTNEELARRTGVALRTVVRWRQGERPPRLPNLVRLADALGVPKSYFIRDMEHEAALEDLTNEVAVLSDRTEVLAERLGEVEHLLHRLLREQMARRERLEAESLELSPH